MLLHIILGTKGQFIKMFPLLCSLREKGIPFQFVHTGQHIPIIEKNIQRVGSPVPDVYLSGKAEDLSSMPEALLWFARTLWAARTLTIREGDAVITHGDTESTLLALCIAKMFRVPLLHIESGLRSFDIWNPFPEEIIRRIVTRHAAVCYCPTPQDADNLRTTKSEVVITHGNTIRDALQIALALPPNPAVAPLLEKRYVLFLVHRKENLWYRKQCSQVLGVLEELLRAGHNVEWVLHKNTAHRLKKSGLWHKVEILLQNTALSLWEGFYDYIDFMHMVQHADFVVSDGGGLQEETHYLGIPLMVLRKKTERQWGIGKTAHLVHFDQEKIARFLIQYKEYRHEPLLYESGSPTACIVQHLLQKVL